MFEGNDACMTKSRIRLVIQSCNTRFVIRRRFQHLSPSILLWIPLPRPSDFVSCAAGKIQPAAESFWMENERDRRKRSLMNCPARPIRGSGASFPFPLRTCRLQSGFHPPRSRCPGRDHAGPPRWSPRRWNGRCRRGGWSFQITPSPLGLFTDTPYFGPDCSYWQAPLCPAPHLRASVHEPCSSRWNRLRTSHG